MSDTAREAVNAADARLLHDRVTAAFGEHYLIGQEIGRGGMAVVYAAEDVKLQRKVALKVLPPDLAFRADVRERFVREAQTAARLNHPHIVPIYAVHEEAGMVCFAMGLVTGESVAARLIREPRPPFAFVAQVLEQTADALAYAHACGVVHRDVKPDNILLDQQSSRALVTDFGIARAAESGSRLTQTGIAVGTPAFMSPEQATGDKDVDGRSDLYSVGVVGYLMLAGRLPFEATTTPAMLIKHVSETPPPILSMRADAPPALVGILEKCLAKRPADRWNSALELRDALRRVQRDGSLSGAGHASASSYPRAASPYAIPYASASERDRVASEYAEKAGHRAEDWSPRRQAPPLVPAPLAPAQARPMLGDPAFPPVPNFPPLPRGATKHEEREWRHARREALRDWRHMVRDQARANRDEWRDQIQYGAEAWRAGVFPARTDEQLINRFKSQLLMSSGMMVFLGVINATTSANFPWAVFPAFGIGLGVLARYSRLRERGITWARIWGDHNDSDPVAQLPKPARIQRGVAAFKRHVKWLAGSAAAAIGSFAIGGAFHLNPMVVPFVGAVIASMASAQMLLVDTLRLRRLGVSPGDAIGDGWKEIAAVSDDRSIAAKVNDQIAQIAGTSVLNSAYGDTVRNAVDDHVAIKDTAARLNEADKSLVPDVEPTADALLERIGALASGLERLERDIPGGAVAQLDARIVAVEAEPESSPDRERRLSLLTRQRASLDELVSKRDTMHRQLESASMALRSLRLDMVKLRTLGVGAAINDVTSATQEARALSVDIGRALYAADEVRKL